MKLHSTVITGLFGWIALAPGFMPEARAAIEFSAGFSFNQSHYTNESYTWTRRWGTSLGIYLTEYTEIELSYQHATDRSFIVGYEDTTYLDQIYSASVNQTLLSKRFIVQPYVKAGLGQLNREATGMYANGASPPAIVDSLTGILGGGVRVYVTKNVGLRVEATSYLTGGNIGTWADNTATTIGLTFVY